MAALHNPYQHYEQNQILTAPPGQLIIMLFDAAIRFCHQAKRALQNKDIETAHNCLVKSQRIITELMTSLNMEYEIAHKIYPLYDYLYRRLVQANMEKNQLIIDEVLDYLSDFRKTWKEAARIASIEGKV